MSIMVWERLQECIHAPIIQHCHVVRNNEYNYSNAYEYYNYNIYLRHGWISGLGYSAVQ